MSKSVNLYVVVPCYNEEAVLHETSKQMLELFGEMKNDGLINDNSRIVFVDDGSKDKTWSIIDELTKADTEISGIKLAKNAGHQPLLWLGGAVKQPMQVDKIMNQTDLAATLLGQLGLEHTAFTFSRNVLGSDYKYPFAFYSFNNGFSFRDSTGVTVFDNNSGSILFDEPEADESRLDKGKAILQTVYDDLGNR